MSDFRSIPSIDRLYQRLSIRALESRYGRSMVVEALRAAAATVRESLEAYEPGGEELVIERIEAIAIQTLGEQFAPSLQPVINATGVIVHTNLGRAPLSESALTRMADVGRGYSTLEYNLNRGTRGRRDAHAEALLCRLTGAESATVVNNNAAATLVVVAALAAGREVIVSRGELVEIGGGFRVPDVMKQSGAILREVGTTNKTRGADYAAAISERTALILRVHPSNFRIEGFTARPELAELVDLGRRFTVPVFEDLGSGYLGASSKLADSGIARTEPAIENSIAAGVDVCSFSGDKLLGGPQSGIIVGRRALVESIRRHPLMRALRVDKMTYAALEATLVEYATGRAAAAIPVQRMLALGAGELRERAQAIATVVAEVAGWRATVLASSSAVGGGSGPGVDLPTWVVAIELGGVAPDALAERLRRCAPPVIARIENDRVVLDLRTVFPEQDHWILEHIRGIRP